jgi:hypothetical protein
MGRHPKPLYEREVVKGLSARLRSEVVSFCLAPCRAPSFRPGPARDGRLRRVGIALAACRACRQEIEHTGAIRRAPDRYQTPLDFGGSPSCEARSAGPAPMSMGSCDDRITLYPAAPLRLATLLHARTIAREGWGSSSQRQIGEAKSAMGFASHASDPPTLPPKGASEPLACHLAFPVVGGLRIAPCGTMPCST